jgi:transposase
MEIAVAAEQESIPLHTAYNIKKKYDTYGSTTSLSHPGRPPKVDERLERQIVHEARKNWQEPFAEIAQNVEPRISWQTVGIILHKHGYHWRVARKVPFLTKAHKAARRRWARANKEMLSKDWARVIWSDECYCYQGDTHERIYVTRRADGEYEEGCVIPTFKQLSLHVMVWGCIIQGQKGPLVVLEYPGGRGGGMNSTHYREQVLKGALKEFYAQMKEARGNVRFQQDGAPSHTSKTT